MVRPRRKRTKSTPYTAPLGHAQHPNAVWAIDFKGDFAIGRTRCYPLTITDSYSRFIIAIVALTNTKTNTVKRALQRIFDEYGLPEASAVTTDRRSRRAVLLGCRRCRCGGTSSAFATSASIPDTPNRTGATSACTATSNSKRHRRRRRQCRSSSVSSISFAHVSTRSVRTRPSSNARRTSSTESRHGVSRSLFEYDMEAEALRVSKDGYIAAHRGAFFLSTTLAHELVEVDWYESNRARVLFGTMKLGELVAKAKRRQLRFLPVESVDLNPPPRTLRRNLGNRHPCPSIVSGTDQIHG